jgi:hypothetical protein
VGVIKMGRMKQPSRTRQPAAPRDIVQVAIKPRAAPQDVVLRYWALQNRPGEAYGLLILSMVLSLAVWGLNRSVLLTTIATCALLIASGRTWFPVRWELGLGGITESIFFLRRKIPWIAITRYEIGEEGVWLFAHRHGNAAPGLFLEFGDRRDAVIGCIEYYLGTWTATGNLSTIAHAAAPPVDIE